jgi:hypothetical protein
VISAIQQSNCVIPSAMGKPRVDYLPADFADSTSFGKKEKKYKTSNVTKALAVSLVLGAAGALVAIGHRQIKLHKLKKEISGLYDKAWEFTSKSFNKANLQIEKPKLKYFFDSDPKSYGSYNQGTNVIRLNLHKFESKEYIVYKGEGKKRVFMVKDKFPFLDLKDIEKMKKDGVIDGSWSTRKATHEEKLFAFNATIAHEQRHCIQYHFILNDSDFGADYLLKDFATKLRAKESDLSQEEAMRLARRYHPYWANFKPKGNTKNLCLLLPAIVKGQDVGFNTKHLARNYSSYNNKNIDEYFANALEIDARAFEWAYLSREEVQKGCAEDVVAMILNVQKQENTEGITKFMLDNKEGARE